MPPICLATTNQGKLTEFKHNLEPLGYNIFTLAPNYPEVPETGLTFVENALIKARAACKYYKIPTLADDSGICVPNLDGAPGIYSARYAGTKATAQNNIDLLLKKMSALKGLDREAYFYCALVYLRYPNDPCPIVATATWYGMIIEEQQGERGFGYDPIFFIPELACTASELSKQQKNQISHRGLALKQLTSALANL